MTIIMKIIHGISWLFAWTTAFFLMTTATQASPVWTFAPLTLTKLSILPGDTAFISYSVTNNSKSPHTLVMTAIPGITQLTDGGNCKNPFKLDYPGASCTLVLQVNGSALARSVFGGPNVCEQSNGLECYQPGSENSLKITKLSPSPGPVQTTLSASVPSLALSVNNTGLNTALTGTPRTITITNTGTNTATNVTLSAASIAALPAGTSITPTNCGTMAPGGTCVLTITPGATPSATPGNTSLLHKKSRAVFSRISPGQALTLTKPS